MRDPIDHMDDVPGHITFTALDLLEGKGYRRGLAPRAFQDHVRATTTSAHVSRRAWTSSVLVPAVTHVLIPFLPARITATVNEDNPGAKANPVQATHINGWQIVREVHVMDVETVLRPHALVLPLPTVANLWANYAHLVIGCHIPRPLAALALTLDMGREETKAAWRAGDLHEDALRTLHALRQSAPDRT